MSRVIIVYRQKILIIALILVGLTMWGMESIYANTMWKSRTFEPGLKDKIIIVDPGHGGADPGAVAGDIYEKNINLAISEKIAKVFQQKGVKAILTRGESGGLNPEKPMNRQERRVHLNKRKKFAIDNRGNIYVSVHTNSIADTSVSGIVVFYSDSSEHSKLMAMTVARQIEKQLGEKVTVKTARYLVIDPNPIPAILIEVGFITNRNDLAKITAGSYQESLAKAIADGIEHYTNLLGKVKAQ